MHTRVTDTSIQLMVQRDLLRSRIARLFLESALWGIFAVLYALGVSELLSGSQPQALARRNRVLISANTVMFLLATVVRSTLVDCT